MFQKNNLTHFINSRKVKRLTPEPYLNFQTQLLKVVNDATRA